MKHTISTKSKIAYVFDVDGTLTPARQQIQAEFKEFFIEWIRDKSVFLVSGSDYEKTLEQIGPEILQNVEASFNSVGNVCYIRGGEVYRNDWTPPQKLIDYLNSTLSNSSYPHRRGNHIEYRIGMINFSIVGRNSSPEERENYVEYDESVHEREKICHLIVKTFPSIDASIGGQISIDIYPKGKNKSQILDHISQDIVFFGDRTLKGGNDYDLAVALNNNGHHVKQVRDWKHTWQLLKTGNYLE